MFEFMGGTGGASASLLRTPEFFTEEVPGIPGGPIRVRGHVKSQEKVRFGEKGGSVQIHRLVQIVGGLMVACSSPLVLERRAIPVGLARLETQVHEDGGYAPAHEAVLIAPDEEHFFWLGVGADAEVHLCRDTLDDVGKAGVLGAGGNDLVERVHYRSGIQVEVGHYLLPGDGGARHEVVRAEESLLLSGHGQKQYGAPGWFFQGGEGVSDLDHYRRPDGVVHGAVVNRVTVDRLTDANVIQMRAVDNVLVSKLRIRAPALADDIGALDALVARDHVLRNGLTTRTYALLPQLDDRPLVFGEHQPTPEETVMFDLMRFAGSESDVIWIDDRWVQSHEHRDSMRIVGTVDLLSWLRDTGKMSPADFAQALNDMRAADVRFVAFDADELVAALREAPIENGTLVETKTLRVLR